MHEQVLKLASLWKQDQARDTVLEALQDLRDKVSKNEAQHARATERCDSLASQLKELRKQERQHTTSMDKYAKKRDKTQAMIDEGRAPDFQVAMSQLARCAELVDDEETILLELMEQIEELQGKHQGQVNSQGIFAQRLAEAEAALEAQRGGLQASIDQATVTRDAARDGIFNDLLHRYDNCRSRGFHPFADVRGTICMGCNVGLERMVIAEHRRGVSVQWCRSCGRYLGELK